MPQISLTPWQAAAVFNPFKHFCMFGGVGCIAGDTKIETINGPREISKLQENELVFSIGDQGLTLVPCGKPFVKGLSRLIRIVHAKGEFVCHERHLIALPDGNYQYAGLLSVGDVIASFSDSLLRTNQASPKPYEQYDQNSFQKLEGLKWSCSDAANRYDRSLLPSEGECHWPVQTQVYAPGIFLSDGSWDARNTGRVDNRLDLLASRQQSWNSFPPMDSMGLALADFQRAVLSERILPNSLSVPQFQNLSDCRQLAFLFDCDRASVDDPLFSSPISKSPILGITIEEENMEYWDVEIPGTQNYIAEGSIHHNTGKTFSLAHFSIFHILHYPHLTGMIGANDHNQLSGVTLKALFYWLQHYGLEFVVDKMPLPHWTRERKFKSYQNILTVYNPRTAKVTYVFLRVLSDPDALRGLEFSWYVFDESRDTPEETFDVVLGRLRESKYIKGLVGTTTNGEDWVYNTFVKAARRGDSLYGAMHVKTMEIVKIGIQGMDWYNGMQRRYTALQCAQELDAEHVNIHSGRAYYAASKENEKRRAPWGDETPNRDRPLVIGTDFNFSPAPCIWMVGQIGPDLYGPNGEYYGDQFHWFSELCEFETGTEMMTMILLSRFPGFFYRIYGDCSGGVGTTSNAGITDYDQMASVLNRAGAQYSIDWFDSDEAQNPRVKKRVENMNRLFCNALGERRMTFNPDACPHFADDVKYTGWKPMTSQGGRGKLSDGGNNQRTHATDGGGYAMMKIFPPLSQHVYNPEESAVQSPNRREYGLLHR